MKEELKVYKMEIPIENLKAKMRGVELNNYQKGLALDEFEKLIAHTEALEQQLRQYNVSGQSEQLICDNHRPDLEHFMKYSESICKNCKQKV